MQLNGFSGKTSSSIISILKVKIKKSGNVHVHVHVATGTQMDYPQEVFWLRKRFQEVPSDSPAPKRVRFKSIHELLAVQFPSIYQI